MLATKGCGDQFLKPRVNGWWGQCHRRVRIVDDSVRPAGDCLSGDGALDAIQCHESVDTRFPGKGYGSAPGGCYAQYRVQVDLQRGADFVGMEEGCSRFQLFAVVLGVAQPLGGMNGGVLR